MRNTVGAFGAGGECLEIRIAEHIMYMPTAAELGSITRFRSDSAEGWRSETWCIGCKVHLHHDKEGWHRGLPRVSSPEPCDGSCCAETDIKELLKELTSMLPAGSKGGLSASVRMDGFTGKALRNAAPFRGVLYGSGYNERGGEWKKLCTGQWHVKIVSISTGARGREHRHDHSVRTSPCDGSCSATVPLNRRTVSLILRALRRMKLDLDSVTEETTEGDDDLRRTEDVEGLHVFRHGPDI